MSESSDLSEIDRRFAEQMFDYVQFLLDDDTNLTPTGNLTSAGRQKLRTRINELISAESPEDVSVDLAQTESVEESELEGQS